MKKITLIIIIFLILIISLFLVYPKKNKEILATKENNSNFLSIMLENGVGTSNYQETNDFPSTGYVLNKTLSKCVNGSKIKYEEGSIYISGNKTDRCYAYFDNIQVKTDFSFTGTYEEYIVPTTGTYKIELWGASGGNNNFCFPNSYGRGAYTTGNINLKKGEKLYIYVGETSLLINQEDLVFNGGPGESVGGGATDIRLNEGPWNNFESLKSRIMVAAGGGGCAFENYIIDSINNQRGDGGALNGLDAKWLYKYDEQLTSNYSGHGATQTKGGEPGILFTGAIDTKEIPEMTGKFGRGGYGINQTGGYTYTSSGGGGGYYGGGHGNHPSDTWTGCGGGSSFISGYPGCDAITENSTEDAIVHTGQPNHYSGKVFTNFEMIAGNATMPSPSGGNEEGHTGYGYAKITLVK